MKTDNMSPDTVINGLSPSILCSQRLIMGRGTKQRQTSNPVPSPALPPVVMAKSLGEKHAFKGREREAGKSGDGCERMSSGLGNKLMNSSKSVSGADEKVVSRTK